MVFDVAAAVPQRVGPQGFRHVLRPLAEPLAQGHSALLCQVGTLVTVDVLAEAAAEAERNHQRLYQAFISGQTGLIAEGLRKELAEHSKAVCPVCHTEFCAEQVHEFAPLPAETPVQANLDAAKQDYDVKEEKRRKQAEKRTAELDQAISQGEDALTAHRLLAGKLDAAISALRDQLKYPNKKTADEQIQHWKDRLDFLKIQVREHLEAQRAAISQRDNTQGTLNGKQNDLPDLERSRAKSEGAPPTQILAREDEGVILTTNHNTEELVKYSLF
ncbi:hypothetical protein [Oscillibacter sp. CU971]|uniref:hypothetical protein n=1 Tax=Oscillibacter sp. CU971 TaxID=2780102 RepID=UPI001FAF6200|nr:hypothetical protein [Oscillibacter sp. CU971]